MTQKEKILVDKYLDCKKVEEAAKKVGQKYFPDEYNIWARENIEAVKAEYAFKDGAKWQKEQFEKNRLKHCDSITNEQAELEQGFIDQHLDKYQRMPTFLDAIEYGMNLQKEKMMTKAIDATIGSFTNGTIYDADFNIDSNLKDNDKVKVIVIKEK